MSDEIISVPPIVATVKRTIAEAMQRQAEAEIPYFPNADRKIKNKDILATILWDIVTNGIGIFADGREVKPESYADWLSTVKYLITHLDGPVAGEEGVGANVFKVYVGVNVDKL